MVEHAQMARFVFNIALEQRSVRTPAKRHFTQKVTVA